MTKKSKLTRKVRSSVKNLEMGIDKAIGVPKSRKKHMYKLTTKPKRKYKLTTKKKRRYY